MIGRLWARNDDEVRAAREQGYDLQEPLTTSRLVSSSDIFFVCTGVTDGELLDGVQYLRGGATTESLVTRGKSGTLRRIQARHTFDKLMQYSAIDFD